MSAQFFLLRGLASWEEEKGEDMVFDLARVDIGGRGS
jgi:hypothetical protein